MRLTAYIHLLEAYSDEFVLQKSLSRLYESINGLFEREVAIYYDGDSVRILLENADEFSDYLESASIHLDILDLLLSKSNKWQDKRCQATDCRYILWEWDAGCREVTNQTLAELAERTFLKHDTTLLFFNMTESRQSRPFLPVFKDALHKTGLPLFAYIDQCFDLGDLDYWLAKSQHPTSFDLRDIERFERTNYIYHPTKQRIYKELNTGYHWYFDFYHKDNKVHYEVFDSTGNVYIGEANAEGNLSPNISGKSRKLIL